MISFQTIDVALPPIEPEIVKEWIHKVASLHHKKVGELYYMFCSDEHLLSMNQTYLNHDFYTDIISFPTNDCIDIISGEFYISIDRIADNAQALGHTYDEELHRVIIHGVLHFIGFKDKTETDAAEMRKQENNSLSLLANILKSNN